MSYYQKTHKFNNAFQQGEMQKAAETLAKIKHPERKKDRVLYYLNKGVVEFMLGNYAQSNSDFDTALSFTESNKNNYFLIAGSFLSNPNLLPYKADQFEILMAHYYMALNYINLKKYDDALVECRRMNLALQQLEDNTKAKYKYKRDAFIHNLMGIIYDAQRDYNNAFIAYRNAYTIYTEDYKKIFGIDAPEQLKKDLLRTAYLTGLSSEVAYYEKQFGKDFSPQLLKDSGQMVFFWLNGMGPVKEQWSINFTVLHGQGGNISFVNEQYGWSFPYYSSSANDTASGLRDLHFLRVAMPKYVERQPFYNRGNLVVNGKKVPLEIAEDLNKIAFQSLQDRMLKELGESLLRLALKKAAEYEIRKENQDLGAAVGIVNFLTEQADTRNWQTIPHSLYYTRVALPPGKNHVQFNLKSPYTGKEQTESLDVNIISGQTIFKTFHTMATAN